jgi:hypothetical protein
MIPQRFCPNSHTGQQLYTVIEHCRKPETLWARLASGNFDWLGMRRDGRFVLGRPRLTRRPVEEEGAARLESSPHRIDHRAPLDPAYRSEGYPTPQAATSAFECIVGGDPVTLLRGSGIWWVRLVVDNEPAEDRLVVRTLPIID